MVHKKIVFWLIVFIVMGANLVLATNDCLNISGNVPSIQIKTTNIGYVNEKPAEIIFDIVNTDFNHNIRAFMLCQSPDDADVSSSIGIGSGSGAQYVSPRFDIDKAPSQRSISIMLDSTTVGDKRAACIIKYIPFRELLKDNKDISQYLKGDGCAYKETPDDSDYKEIRLDKEVSFIKNPSPKKETKKEEKTTEFSSSTIWIIAGVVVIIILFVVYLLGKTSRK